MENYTKGHAMGDKFTLNLYNRSKQPNFTFAVYTVAPVTATTATYPLAWLAKKVNPGNDISFTWTLDYSLMYSAKGCQAGAVWTESKKLSVNDQDASQNAAKLDYPNGDYTFDLNPGPHPAKSGFLYIDTTGTVPAWTQSGGPSVALAIATGDNGTPTPAIAGDSGPNLHHSFELHPTYYINAGDAKQGVMADLSTVTGFAKVTFPAGKYEADWTLNEANMWVAGKPK